MLPSKYSVPALLLMVTMLVLASCQSSETVDPTPTTAAAPTATATPLPVVTATATTEATGDSPVDGACRTSPHINVSVGDTWTLSGRITILGNAPFEFPAGAVTQITTYSITAIEPEEFVTGDRASGARTTDTVENARITAQAMNAFMDENGEVLDSAEEEGTWSSLRIGMQGPVLTLDWSCHSQAWLESWSEGTSQSGGATNAAVRETTLPSGIVAVVFSVDQEFDLPSRDLKFAMTREMGYDKQTGKIVLVGFSGSGTQGGGAFSGGLSQQIEDDSSA